MKDLPIIWLKESLRKAKKELKELDNFYNTAIADKKSILGERVNMIIQIRIKIVKMYND